MLSGARQERNCTSPSSTFDTPHSTPTQFILDWHCRGSCIEYCSSEANEPPSQAQAQAQQQSLLGNVQSDLRSIPGWTSGNGCKAAARGCSQERVTHQATRLELSASTRIKPNWGGDPKLGFRPCCHHVYQNAQEAHNWSYQ